MNVYGLSFSGDVAIRRLRDRMRILFTGRAPRQEMVANFDVVELRKIHARLTEVLHAEDWAEVPAVDD